MLDGGVREGHVRTAQSWVCFGSPKYQLEMETSPFMLIPVSLKLSRSSHCSLLSLGAPWASPTLLASCASYQPSPFSCVPPATNPSAVSALALGLRNNCKAELANYFPNIVPTVHYAPSKPSGRAHWRADRAPDIRLSTEGERILGDAFMRMKGMSFCLGELPRGNFRRLGVCST